MNHRSNKKERKSFLNSIKKGIFSLFLFFMVISCKNDLEKIYELESTHTPDIVIKDPTILRSSSGNVDIKIQAPTAKQFFSEPASTEFPDGVFLIFYGIDRSINSTLAAQYAISNDDSKIMEARNDVVIIDFQKGDTIYTEQIIWDQNIEKIYSNKPVKSVNGDNITYGDGFEMNDKTNVATIFNQRGTLEWED